MDDAAGPQFRKIALTGRPIPDEEPERDPETDLASEDTYVDALNLGLRHSTTDVYIPLVGGQITLGVRRDLTNFSWNPESDIQPQHRPDLFFGAGWQTGLVPYIQVLRQRPTQGADPNTVLDPDMAIVTDENGAAFRFVMLFNLPGNPGVHWFPLPNNRVQQDSRMMTLTSNGGGGFVFVKKYGTKITFTESILLKENTTSANSITSYDYHRVTSVEDRFGTSLTYSYDSNETLIPESIESSTGQTLSINSNGDEGQITAIQDPRGNTYTYEYDTRNPTYWNYNNCPVLVKVTKPGAAAISNYDYSVVTEYPDLNAPQPNIPYFHLDVDKIWTDNYISSAYRFEYEFDHTRFAYSSATNSYFFTQGSPRNLTRIILPEGGNVDLGINARLLMDLGGTTFRGYRGSWVRDCEGNARSYEWDMGMNPVYTMSDYEIYMRVGAQGQHPLNVPRLVVWDKLVIRHFEGGNVNDVSNEILHTITYTPGAGTTVLGTEIVDYDEEAGMAIRSMTDFCGNETSFTYTDTWSYSGVFGYKYTKFSEPNTKTTADGTQTFTYEEGAGAQTWRVMKSVVDEKGRLTSYTLNGDGLPSKEEIFPPLSPSPVRVTHTQYGNPTFSAFVTKQTVESLPGDPSWTTDLVTQFIADSAGRRWKTIVDPSGLVLETIFTYDANHNKLSATDPRGHTTTFSYDALNRLTKTSFPVAIGQAAEEMEIEYDSRGNKVMLTDENGNVTVNSYDLRNRLTATRRRMADPESNDSSDLVTTFTYNLVNSQLTVTDPNGQSSGRFLEKTYDALQRVVQIQDPEFGITSYTYDKSRNCGSSAFASDRFKPTKSIDAEGYITLASYDELYRPLVTAAQYRKGSSPAWAYTVNEYDAVGNKTHTVVYEDFVGTPFVTSPSSTLKQDTETLYDHLYRPVETRFPDSAGDPDPDLRTRAFYTSTGLLWQREDELERITETRYDAAGRPVEIIQPEVWDEVSQSNLHPVTLQEFDGNGNVIALTNPLGEVWNYEFDPRNRKTVELQPEFDSGLGRPELERTYDGVGNPSEVKDAKGYLTTTHYDRNNRPVLVEQPEVDKPTGGRARPETHTEYDKNGNPVKVTDANEEETVNEYDGLNRLLKTTDAEGIEVSFAYDQVGNRTGVTDGRLQTTLFAYDGLKRNTVTTDPEDESVTLVYNALQNIARIDSEAQEKTNTYDKSNRLVAVTYQTSTPIERTYAYDLVGNILSVTETDSRANVAYTWDALNRLYSETSAGETHQHRYDLAGNLRLTVFGDTGRRIESTYNELNWLEQIDEVEGLTTRTTVYTFDLNGNNLTRTLPNSEITTRTFDELNRTATLTSPAATYDQVYDLVGNVLEITETYPDNAAMDRTVTNHYDKIYRLVEEDITSPPGGATPKNTLFEYDGANNRTKRTVDTVVTDYTYNTLNQLTSHEPGTAEVAYTYDKNGNRTSRDDGTVTTTYGYDFDNRLTAVEIGAVEYEYVYDYRTRRVARTEDGVATRIVYNGGTSVMEYTDGTPDVLTVEYVRGSDMGGGIGGLLYSVRGGVASFTQYNHRGDVVSKTDDAGDVTYQAEYDAFGEHPVETGSTPDRQRANTKEEDPTGLLNEGFRYRDIETGAFLTRDPLGFVDGPNLYTYVRQNPWTRFDPLGLKDELTEKQKYVVGDAISAIEKTKAGQTEYGKTVVGKLRTMGREGKIKHKTAPGTLTDGTKGSYNRETGEIVIDADANALELITTLAEEGVHSLQFDSARKNRKYTQNTEVEAKVFANAASAELDKNAALLTESEVESHVDRNYKIIPIDPNHQNLEGFEDVRNVSEALYQNRKSNRNENFPSRLTPLPGGKSLWRFPDGTVRQGETTQAPPPNTPVHPGSKPWPPTTPPPQWKKRL